MAVTRIKRISNIPDKINLLQNNTFPSFSSHEEEAKIFGFRSSYAPTDRRKVNFAQVRIEYIRGTTYAQKESSLQIQTPTFWHLTGRSLTAPPPVLSSSTILPISPTLIPMWNTQYENSVLRRTFGTKRGEVTGKWRRLHNEELYDLYSSPNVIRVIKSGIIRWAGHVTRMREEKVAYRTLMTKPERKK